MKHCICRKGNTVGDVLSEHKQLRKKLDVLQYIRFVHLVLKKQQLLSASLMLIKQQNTALTKSNLYFIYTLNTIVLYYTNYISVPEY